MNSLEAQIDAFLTRYFGYKWKSMAGSLLIIAGIYLDEEAIELAGLSLLGIGLYHKTTRNAKSIQEIGLMRDKQLP